MKAISLNQSIRFDSDISIHATVWAAGSNWTGSTWTFKKSESAFLFALSIGVVGGCQKQLDFCRKLGLRKT